MTENIDEEAAIEVTPKLDVKIQALTSSDVEALEKRAENFKRVLGVAVKMTNSRDWLDMGGDLPFLAASGAQKIAVPFGISYGPVEDIKSELREDGRGKYLLFTAHYFAQWGQTRVEFIGLSSTRSKFFSHAGKLGMEEVSIPHLMANAQANALGRCIKKILGIEGITWDELEAYGVPRRGAAKVDYGKKTAAAETKAERSEGKSPIWRSEFKGTNYLWAREVEPFKADFLSGLGMKHSPKKKGIWFTTNHIDDVERELRSMLDFVQKEPEELPELPND